MDRPIEFRLWGPPGTGKTTTIVAGATRSADRYGDDQVSICSLTNAAIREAVSRDIPIDQENLTTLHARCKRSLGAPPPAESFMDGFIKDCPRHASEGCIPSSYLNRSFDRDNNERIMTGGVTLYDIAQINRQQMIPMGEWRSDVLSWHRVWADWCRSKGLMDYTGWLETTLEAGSLPPQQVVYVDEAQDHTPLQLEVVRTWPTRQLVLVGDDDQNLYEWSGAIPDRFFHPELPSEREKVLGQSYRLPREVYILANHVLSRISRRRLKEYSPRDSEGWTGKSDYRLSDAKLGDPMPHLSDSGTHMILTSCSYMLNDIILSLRDLGIPFHNPYRGLNIRWNPLGTDAATVAKGYLIGEWTGSVVHAWGKVLDAQEVFKDREGFLSFCDENREREILPCEIRPFIRDASVEAVLSRSPKTLIKLRRKLAIGSWEYYTKVFKQGVSHEPRVIVGTIHSVKGGEADVVHIFPDLSSSGFHELSDRPDRIHRLFYVAVTRAREAVIIHGPSGYNSYNL